MVAQEIELKLVLTAAEADTFLSSGLMPGKPTAQKLRAIYFDTPDNALLAAGISLRIRRAGNKRIQTIKGADTPGAGLFARSEWEVPVRDDHPVFDERTPVPAILGDTVNSVVAAFEVKVERLTWTVEGDEASVEVVLDRGAAIAGGRQSPVCEIELELKHGEQSAVFALARKIAEAVPVRIGVMTKAERGYALLGSVHKSYKADPIRLDETTASAAAFQAIAGLCIRQYRLNEMLILEDSAPEALHQARVSLRRLRSALAIFKPVLIGGQVPHFQSELRWLTGVLGEARDLDVLVGRVRPGDLKDRLQAAREQAYESVRMAADSGRVRVLLFDLAEWLATGAWLTVEETRTMRELPAKAFAQQSLHSLRKRLKKRVGALKTLSDEQRHEARKAAKRLRYGAEFFGSLFSSGKRSRRLRKFTASLELLQDQLGTLNDLVAAPQVLERLDLMRQPGSETLLAHGKKAKLISASEEAYVDLMDRENFWS